MRNEASRSVGVTLTHRQGYEFRVVVEGDEPAGFLVDEDPPLGSGSGPSPAALLAAAVGDCLASSLLFCLAKARVKPERLDASAVATLSRNAQGRLRITNIGVELRPAIQEDARFRFERCENLFEDFCTVTQSIRQGIPVKVTVVPKFAAEVLS